MAQRKHAGLFGEVAIRARQDALYERLIDRCWEEVRDVFERPDVKDAEAVIMHAIAEAFAPGGTEEAPRAEEVGARTSRAARPRASKRAVDQILPR